MTQQLDQAIELVRMHLGRTICGQYTDEENTLHVLTLSPQVEEQIQSSVTEAAGGTICAPPPEFVQELVRQLHEGMQQLAAMGHEPVVLTAPQVRRYVRALVGQELPTLAVLSHAEIVAGVRVKNIATITVPALQAVAA